jgi:carbonic anhydrase/acetyltransferase-like protein (isoleucine patch superfamily)
MIRYNPQGDYPEIDKTVYIDPSAVIIGKVKIGKNVFVAPGAVIRADEPGSSVSIGENCNVQDRVIIHALGNSSVIIGKNTSLSHGCIVHGPCKIGKECFVGFGSVIFNAKLQDEVFVKFLATVLGVNIPSRRIIPDGAVIDTVGKVRILSAVSKECREFNRRVLKANLDLLKGYKEE